MSAPGRATGESAAAKRQGLAAGVPHLERLLAAAQGGVAGSTVALRPTQRPTQRVTQQATQHVVAPTRAVSLHIERLSLVGLPYSSSQARLIGAAAERELTRLIGGASATSAWAGGSVPAVAAVPLSLAPNWSPERVGQAVGAQVFAAVGEFCSPASGDRGVLP